MKGKDPFLGCRIGNDCGKAFAHTRFVAGDCQDVLSAHPKTAAAVENRIVESATLFVNVFRHDNVGAGAKDLRIGVDKVLAAGVKGSFLGGGFEVDIFTAGQGGQGNCDAERQQDFPV